MKLQFKRSNDLIFIDKPAGIPTHSPDHGKKGICEIFEEALQTKLYIAHRLDKMTTGAMVFALTAEKAAWLTELFQTREIKKKYTFITDRASTEWEFENATEIEGKKSRTLFKRLKRSPFFELWEAVPLTGRPHQIRIHASRSGLPILGDESYGGTPFPHLCLNSAELHVPGEEPWLAPHPRFMERLGLLKDPTLCAWLSEIDRRQRLYRFLDFPNDCLRLIHLPHLRMDQFGEQIWFYWYNETSPTEKDLSRCRFIGQLLRKKWLLRKMQDRGADANQKFIWTSEDWASSWTARENGLIYRFQSEKGQSPGLFLDQRGNRARLKSLCSDAKVLNLFSYTGGFTVNAAAGGAAQVSSVDLSSGFLGWSKENLALSGFNPETFEFFQQEALLFLNGAQKRKRLFDLIVCDPPSFGRHRDGIFRLEQDWRQLLTACWKCLSPGGTLLFSCNLEKWSLDEFRSSIQKVLGHQTFQEGVHGWDFELPNLEPLMKSFWIKKDH